jgi:hypothetical protein
VLLHHPYDSFDAFIAFIEAAANDPSVLSIEQTVYRVDAKSPLIGILKEAAKRKKVRVIIELRARFDEYNNLSMADELRKAGAEVAYGFGKLKLHAKIALVSRREAGGVRLYTHLSTGNYNATTARMYTDLAILSDLAALAERQWASRFESRPYRTYEPAPRADDERDGDSRTAPKSVAQRHAFSGSNFRGVGLRADRYGRSELFSSVEFRSAEVARANHGLPVHQSRFLLRCAPTGPQLCKIVDRSATDTGKRHP